jgi:hypothetical protein
MCRNAYVSTCKVIIHCCPLLIENDVRLQHFGKTFKHKTSLHPFRGAQIFTSGEKDTWGKPSGTAIPVFVANERKKKKIRDWAAT